MWDINVSVYVLKFPDQPSFHLTGKQKAYTLLRLQEAGKSAILHSCGYLHSHRHDVTMTLCSWAKKKKKTKNRRKREVILHRQRALGK